MVSMAAYFSGQWASHRQLLRAGQLTDLLLLCRDGPVPLHRILLTTRSPLLASLLSPLQEDSPHTVLLPGVRAATVWLLLDILYSGRCRIRSSAELHELRDLLAVLDLGEAVSSLVLVQQQEQLEEDATISQVLDAVLGRASRSVGGRVIKRRRCWSPQDEVLQPEARKRRRNTVEDRQEEDRNFTHVEEDMFECTEPKEEQKATVEAASCTDPTILGSTCCLCGMVHSSNYRLRAHLATQHFSAELLALLPPALPDGPLPCGLCPKSYSSGPRAVRAAVVHRGLGHGALLPLYRAREAELSAMRQCGLCATVAPLCVGQATIPLQLRDGQVPGQLFLLQSGAALAHHLATSHYLATLLEGLLPGQSHCHLCNLTCSSQEVLAVHLGVCHGQVLGIYSQGVREDEASQANIEDTDLEGNIVDIEKVEDAGETEINISYYDENEDVKLKESNSDPRKNKVFEEELKEGETEAEIESGVIVKSIIDNIIEHMFVNTHVFHEDSGSSEEEAEVFKEGESVLNEKPFLGKDLNINTRLNSRAAVNTMSDFTCCDGEQLSNNSPSLGTSTKNLGITDVGPVTRSKANKRVSEKNAVEVNVTKTMSPKSECWEETNQNREVLTGCKTVNGTEIRKQEYEDNKLEICNFVWKEGEDAHKDIEEGGLIDINAIMKSIINDVVEDMFVGIKEAISLDSGSLKTKRQEVSLRKREVLTRSQSAKISRTRKLKSKRKGSESNSSSDRSPPVYDRMPSVEFRLESGLGIQFKTEDILLGLEK